MPESGRPASPGSLVVFGAKQIRRVWLDGEWFFSVVDIVAALTDSLNPRDYWYRLKRREKESSGIELSTLCRQLKLLSSDGEMYAAECVNAKTASPLAPRPQQPRRIWTVGLD